MASAAAVAREQAAAAKTRTIGLGRRELARLRGCQGRGASRMTDVSGRRRIVNDEHGPGSAGSPGSAGIRRDHRDSAPSAQRQPECQNVHGHRPSGGGGEPSQSTTRRSDPRRREGRRRRVFAIGALPPPAAVATTGVATTGGGGEKHPQPGPAAAAGDCSAHPGMCRQNARTPRTTREKPKL